MGVQDLHRKAHTADIQILFTVPTVGKPTLLISHSHLCSHPYRPSKTTSRVPDSLTSSLPPHLWWENDNTKRVWDDRSYSQVVIAVPNSDNCCRKRTKAETNSSFEGLGYRLCCLNFLFIQIRLWGCMNSVLLHTHAHTRHTKAALKRIMPAWISTEMIPVNSSKSGFRNFVHASASWCSRRLS